MFDRLKTFIIQADARLPDGAAGLAPLPRQPATPAPFTASVRPMAPNGVSTNPSRQQQLISLTLENLLHATRRLSVADLTAAAIDLKRVAYKAGKAPSELLNAADPSGRQVFDHLASTTVDVKEKLGVLLSLGCRLDQCNARGDNAMHAAARLGNGALVEALALRSSVMSSMRTARADPYTAATPLAIAIIGGHPGAARPLLRQHPGLAAPCCLDAERVALTPQELYARLDNRSPDMSRALRTGHAAADQDARVHPLLRTPRPSEPRVDA